MTDSTPSFGYWVRRQRLALDLTQAVLAGLVGCAPVTIRKIEADERRPSRQLAVLLAENLAIEEDEQANFIKIARADRSPNKLSLPTQPVFSSEGQDAVLIGENFLANPSLATPTAFVARNKELAVLEHMFEKAMAKQGSVVFVVGEAGYGKTTLMHEFTHKILGLQPDSIVAKGSSNAFSGMGDPYLPFRDILGMLSGDFETQWTAGALSHQQAVNLLEFAPQVREVITQEGPDLLNLLEPGKLGFGNTGEREQIFLFEQFTQVFHSLSRRRPLILLLDDLQWADSASLSLLFHLGMRLANARLLIIGSYRPSDVSLGRRQGFEGVQHPLPEMVNEFRRRFGDIKINLGDNTSKEGREFVSAYIDTEPNLLDVEFREALFARTQGHPLFTSELLRAIQEKGDIYLDENNYWVASPTLNWEELPARVEAVIDQRLGRLDDGLREILSVASIEGEYFTAQVVAQVIGEDERALLRQLSSDLETRHRLVLEQGEVETKEGTLDRYKFSHVLFQEYQLNKLSRAEKRLLHRAVAEAIEALYGIDRPEVAPQLANHYRLAGDRVSALKYTLDAASLAENMNAFDEALQHLHQALDMLPTGEQTPDRIAILERLGDDYALLGERPRAISLFERALDLWHIQKEGQITDAVRLHRKIGEMVVFMTWYQDRLRFESTGHNILVNGLNLAKDTSPNPETARLLTTLANEAWFIQAPADWDLAENYALQAVAMADDINSDTELSAALEALGNVYGGRGNFRKRLNVSLRRLALSNTPDFRDQRQKANILQQTGFAYLQVGEYREALPYLFEAENISKEIQALDQLYRALRHQATCWFRLDEWDNVLVIEEKRKALVERYPNFDERVGPT
jgi:tetratricopeptide (TPR) repeat protein/transcriptional regulator with XRE-family HTH domain